MKLELPGAEWDKVLAVRIQPVLKNNVFHVVSLAELLEEQLKEERGRGQRQLHVTFGLRGAIYMYSGTAVVSLNYTLSVARTPNSSWFHILTFPPSLPNQKNPANIYIS